MKWTPKPPFDYEEWHRWFAWYSVELEDGRCAWLEYVERKLTGYSIDYVACWRYRATKRQ